MGQNSFSDEKDGKKDVIVITQDNGKLDLVSGLDKKDQLFIQPKNSENSDESLEISSAILPSLGDALVISLAGQGIAYYTGGDLSINEIGEMVTLL